MILYYAPGVCSLAVHIALREAGLQFDMVKVDLRTKSTEQGKDFRDINPKGYLPALVLEDDTCLTEMVSILYWVATRDGAQHLPLLDVLAFLATEIHKHFLVANFGPNEECTRFARDKIIQRYQLLSTQFEGEYLFGDNPTVADIYLYVTLRWSRSEKLDITLPEALEKFYARMDAHPATHTALEAEGLT